MLGSGERVSEAVLIEVCSKHPRYRALRKPTADCAACHMLFKQAELERNKRFNIRGDEVKAGTHLCVVCQKMIDHPLMAYTSGPKLCLECYYGL